MTLDGFQSRPLRETELHSRVSKAGLAFKATITWVDVPMSDEEGNFDIGSTPILYPSNLAQSLIGEGLITKQLDPVELDLYWSRMLKDFPAHPLSRDRALWRSAIPIVLWGDEGSVNSRRSWMLCSWTIWGEQIVLVPSN